MLNTKSYTAVAERLEDTQIIDTDSFRKLDSFVRNAIYNGYAVTIIDRLHRAGMMNIDYSILANENMVSVAVVFAGK